MFKHWQYRCAIVSSLFKVLRWTILDFLAQAGHTIFIFTFPQYRCLGCRLRFPTFLLRFLVRSITVNTAQW